MSYVTGLRTHAAAANWQSGGPKCTMHREDELETGPERTMHGRVGVERPGNALQLAHHALGGLSVGQHKVDGAHTLSIQPCA